jgi:YbgC/YbaW family acyl-CoA thioester hydrolase
MPEAPAQAAEINHCKLQQSIANDCKPRPAMPETPSIITREEVMFFDTDCAAVVHNLAYLRMIETARTRLAAQLGMKLREMSQSQLYPVVLRTEIDYKKPALLGDELEVHGRLDRVERVRFWCAFEMRRPSDGALLITCRQSLALVQMPAGKPVRLPEDWTEKYSHLCAWKQ